MLQDPFNHLAVPSDIVARFFAVFARCEYAMKETSYRRDDHGIAAPAWQRLANDAATWLVVPAGSDLEQALSLLTEKPPRLQSFTGGLARSAAARRQRGREGHRRRGPRTAQPVSWRQAHARERSWPRSRIGRGGHDFAAGGDRSGTRRFSGRL
jgi:hypothetical protein